MYIDLTCPAEVFRTILPTEEIPAAALTLFNLSDRVITSVEVMLRLPRPRPERPAPLHLHDDGAVRGGRRVRGGSER